MPDSGVDTENRLLLRNLLHLGISFLFNQSDLWCQKAEIIFRWVCVFLSKHLLNTYFALDMLLSIAQGLFQLILYKPYEISTLGVLILCIVTKA